MILDSRREGDPEAVLSAVLLDLLGLDTAAMRERYRLEAVLLPRLGGGSKSVGGRYGLQDRSSRPAVPWAW